MVHTRYQRKSDHRGKTRPGGRCFAVRVCFRHGVPLIGRGCPICIRSRKRTIPRVLAAKRKKRDRRGQSKPR